MPKVRCKCQKVIDLTPIPCPDGFELISEDAINLLYSAEISEVAELIEQLRRHSKQVYKCPNCERLLVFWDEGGNAAFYKLDV